MNLPIRSVLRVCPRAIGPAALLTVLFALAGAVAPAAAQSLGVAVGPFTEGSPVIGASLSLPVVARGAESPVRVLARFDVTTATDFVTPPSLGFMPVVEAGIGSFVGYAGAGYSMAWEELDGASSSFGAWVLLAGARVPVSGRVGLKTEVVGAPREEAFGMVFGIEVAPWR